MRISSEYQYVCDFYVTGVNMTIVMSCEIKDMQLVYVILYSLCVILLIIY